MAGFNHLSGTFEMDYAALPELVAITGDNGQGKTSLALEGPLAGLFGPGAATRAFASREGNLARYATSATAFIEDTWQLSTGIYRVRVNVDGVKRTTDAVLLQVLATGTEMPLNDGKTSTFKEQVAARFPSQRSLLAGPFAGQTRRGSFGELGQKERMELFVELADLAHLEELALTCRNCKDVADGVVERLRAALEALRREADSANPAQAAARMVEITALAVQLRQDNSTACQRLQAAQADRDRLQAVAERHAVASALASAARAEVGRAEERLAQVDKHLAASNRDVAYTQLNARHAEALAGISQRRARAQQAHDSATRDRTERIGNNAGLLASADRIHKAVTDTAAASTDIARHSEAEASARAGHAAAREEHERTRRQLTACDVAATDLASAERRAALLGTVKFGDDCGVPPVCPLVTDAVAARETVAALRQAAAPAPELREAVSYWQAEMQRHTTALAEAQDRSRTASAVVESCRADVAREGHLRAAETRISEYRADQLAADGQHGVALEQLQVEAATAEAARSREAAVADEAMLQAQAATAERRAVLGAELAAVRATAAATAREAEETAHAPGQLAMAVAACAEAQAAISQADTGLVRLATEREHLEARLAALERLQRRTAELERRTRVAEDERLAWHALAQRLGRDGLQRLEIDAAGPVVSDLANQLLEVGWGTRFGVAIVTQVATADKKEMKEKFTIEVLDNLHGGEPRDIGDLSGGERVVVEEAIRAALACYVNRRSRDPFRQMWRDEADGGLSAEKGERYVQMLRKLRELSGAEQVVFITHRPELAEMADAVVRVAGGQVESIRSVA
jgi:exonuclease SbcC